jgi:hypothetical protein
MAASSSLRASRYISRLDQRVEARFLASSEDIAEGLHHSIRIGARAIESRVSVRCCRPNRDRERHRSARSCVARPPPGGYVQTRLQSLIKLSVDVGYPAVIFGPDRQVPIARVTGQVKKSKKLNRISSSSRLDAP